MKNKRRFEFSKLIIIFETILVAYITHRSLGFIGDAVSTGFTGTLPYLTTLLTVAWGAYGTSTAFYYNKAKGENTRKIENVVKLKEVEKDL